MNESGHHSPAGRPTASDAAEWSLGRLLSTAARLVEQDWNSWLASRDLTHAGLLALHVLTRAPHTQRELAAACMVEEQTMNRVLGRLARAGYVSRQRDPADRRRLIVRATATGQHAYRAAIDTDIANTIITDRVTEPEILRHQLVQLVASLLAARGEQVPGGLLADSPGDPATRDGSHRRPK
jgi:DNA-binding MarR family transcriptional regulator